MRCGHRCLAYRTSYPQQTTEFNSAPPCGISSSAQQSRPGDRNSEPYRPTGYIPPRPLWAPIWQATRLHIQL